LLAVKIGVLEIARAFACCGESIVWIWRTTTATMRWLAKL